MAYEAMTAVRPDTGMSWRWPPFFMLRLGGISTAAVALLRFPDSVEWAERALELEQELAARRQPFADALEDAVGGLADGSLRRQLLDLRRDVFNLRRPRHADDLPAVAAQLPAATGTELLGWLDLWARQERCARDGEEVVAAELTSRRQHLREVVDHPHVRQGLLLASPSLDRYLPTYLDAPAGALGKRARRIERSVLEYVYRTACKTSPFSSFTAVGLGRFRPDGGALVGLNSTRGEWPSHTRLNLAVVSRLAEILLAEPELRGDLPLRVTQGWREDRDRIRYVRRELLAGDSDAPVTMDRVRESLFYLNSSSVLDEVFEILPEGSALRFAELADRLRSNPAEHRSREQVTSYLGHLIRLGLLVAPALHVDIHSPDPVRAFRDGVAMLDRGWAARLTDRLDDVARAADDYRAAPLDDRRRLLEEIRLTLTDAQLDLGARESTIPRTLLYEDVSLPAGRAVADLGRWEEQVKPALTGLARILPVFDLTLPQRLVTRGFFTARFGAGGHCDDVVRFVHEFHQDFYEQYLRNAMQRREFDEAGEYVPQANWLKLPELDALDSARRTLIEQMRARYAAHPSDDQELVLDDDFVDQVAAGLPDCFGDLDPHCFFLQVGAERGEEFTVLNRAYSGLTLQFSRFAHCFPDGEGHGLGAGLRATLADVCPPGAVFAELTGGHESTNLNLHPAVTPYELVCPGDISFRPESEQIPVGDLIIEDDERGSRLRLRSRRLGVEVIPVYLGFLVPMALPEIQRLLMNFSYTSMARVDFWSGVDRPLGGAAIGGHPRLRYRDLVLTRRLWKCDPARLPQRGQDQTDAQALLAWTRWRRENGLPPRVFVSPDLAGGDDPQEDPGGRPAMAGTTKPQFVDFESVFSLSLLENSVRSATHRLIFTEMLPDLPQLVLRPDGEPYVSELTVEIDGVRREQP